MFIPKAKIDNCEILGISYSPGMEIFSMCGGGWYSYESLKYLRAADYLFTSRPVFP